MVRFERSPPTWVDWASKYRSGFVLTAGSLLRYELGDDGEGGDLSLGGGWIRAARRRGLEAPEGAETPALP